jgi:threonine/homoserine/homoserine lactone efflux protein
VLLTPLHATFFLSSVLLALSPGPDNLFVLIHSAQHGTRSGLMVVLGLCSGLLFHTAAVALGLAALLATSPVSLRLLTSMGAAYLLWLAWQSWHAGDVTTDNAQSTPLSPRQSYLRGVWMNISNPKVGLFFLAFLPQFVQTDVGLTAWQQVCLLGGLFMLAALGVFGCIALGAGRWGPVWLAAKGWQTRLHKMAALLFVALGLRLLWA